MGKRIATACQVWMCVRRAHLLERLLQLVQLVKAQRLQVDPTIAVGHLRGGAGRSRRRKGEKERPFSMLFLPELDECLFSHSGYVSSLAA